ncbi:hypothetical protein BLA15816_04704 [Burkholderia lata]|nr:hypothetical protein BLA15816_04704 [Burkholderia lata]
MPCIPFRFPDGMSGIVCTRGRKRAPRCSVPGCQASSAFQCDFHTTTVKTCDRHLCAVHAHEVGDDVHFCPTHLAESSGKKQAQGELF